MFADDNQVGAVADALPGLAGIEMGRDKTHKVQQGEMLSPAYGEE